MDKGFDYKGYGWGLPKNYYKYLIEKIGLDLLFIFVSDDPEVLKEILIIYLIKFFLKIMKKLLICLSYLNASTIFYQEVLSLGGCMA